MKHYFIISLFLIFLAFGGLLIAYNWPDLPFTLSLTGAPTVTSQPVTATPAIEPSPTAPPDDVWRSYTNGNYINALAVDDHYIWAGTNGGVVRWSRVDGSYVKYTNIDGLAENNVQTIALDSAGRVWVKYKSGGVGVFDGQKWANYTSADGLAGNPVTLLAVDPAGHIWLGADGTGISKFDNRTVPDHAQTTYLKMASPSRWTPWLWISRRISGSVKDGRLAALTVKSGPFLQPPTV